MLLKLETGVETSKVKKPNNLGNCPNLLNCIAKQSFVRRI